MKKMSKWIVRTVIMVLIFTVYVGYSTIRHAENYIVTPTDLEYQRLMTKAENIYPTKAFSDILIVDEEKEYFAVHNYGDTSKIVDGDGNILIDTGITEPLYIADYLDFHGFYDNYVTDKKYLKATDSNGTVIVDLESLNMIETDYEDVNVHTSGKYFVGETYDSNYVLQTLGGKVLYESNQPLWLTTDEGYIICYLGDNWATANVQQAGDYGLLNLETGKIEYESKYQEEIQDKAMGYTVVQRSSGIFEYVIMDENYEDVLDGQSFWSVTVYEDYIATTALEGCYSGKTATMTEHRSEISVPRVYNKDLKCIFEGEKGYELLYIENGVVISESLEKGSNKHTYAKLSEGGAVNE